MTLLIDGDTETRPPLPPFTLDTAIQKVRAAEDGWNSCDPERGGPRLQSPESLAQWGGIHRRVSSARMEPRAGLSTDQGKELWALQDNRIDVRFAYEWHGDAGNWFRLFGNENWELDEQGLMRARHASINHLPIREQDRAFRWP